MAADFPTLNQNTTGTAANITGVLNTTSLPALTGDVTNTAGSAATTISANAVTTAKVINSAITNAKLANMGATTIKGNNTGASAAPLDLTGTQVTALLDVFNTTKGLVPGVTSNTTQYLRADGTFAVPPGATSGTVTSVAVTTANGVSGTVTNSTTTPAISLTLGAITPASVASTGTISGTNLSGTNTGDETSATIKTKLGTASATTSGYLTLADWNAFNAATTSNWSLSGNSGTIAGTHFIGTTDAQDVVVKANNIERLRIIDGVSASTGTSGDITIGDATSGTIRSTKEFVMREEGDLYGPSTLRLRNRTGENGAIFETIGTSANLVDFIFRTGTAGSPLTSNIRFEARPGAPNTFVTGNTAEWQFGQAANPTFVVSANTTGNAALLTGNLGIGAKNPTTKLYVAGANPLTLLGVADGTTTSTDSLLTISGGLVKKLPVSTFTNGTNYWSTTGNTSAAIATNFIGTTNATSSLRFRTNNVQGMLLDSAGNVSIGNAPLQTAGANMEKLLVDAGSTAANPTSSYNLISGKGYLNNYLQLNIQNKSAGTNASSDVVATNDAGTEANGINFIDMGVNSSGNTSTGVLGGANTAYLYSTGADLAIGNATAAKNLLLFTGGTLSANERMRIDGSGNVGIGTTAPTSNFEVNGSVSHSIVRTSTNLTLNATHYTVIINSGSTPTLTLPDPTTCAGRVYVIVNQTNANRSIAGYNYYNLQNASTVNIAQKLGITLQSDGTSWYQIQ